MSEFDFDEIDKAVTSAMGGTTPVTAPAPASRDLEPEVQVPSPAPQVEIKEVTPAVPVTPEAPKPVAPAARRSTGRIMDVMPRSTAPRPVVAKAVINSPAPAPIQEKPADIDLAPTPFLPDANTKVEKRPLGSGIGEAEESAPLTSPIVEQPAPEPESVPELGSVDQPIGNDAPIPAELNKDVMSLESAIETPEEPPVAGTSPEASVEVDPEPVLEKPVPDVAPSIVQQYQEKQSSSADQPGAIYDTQQYHTPLKEQTKKKSPVFFIIAWIIGLVVVGAAAGWAVYTFVLPLI